MEQVVGKYNLTVNDRKVFKEPFEPSIDGNPIPELVAQTFIDTRGKIKLQATIDEYGLIL